MFYEPSTQWIAYIGGLLQNQDSPIEQPHSHFRAPGDPSECAGRILSVGWVAIRLRTNGDSYTALGFQRSLLPGDTFDRPLPHYYREPYDTMFTSREGVPAPDTFPVELAKDLPRTARQ